MAEASSSKVDGIEYVTLISSDGYHFLVDRRCAILSAPLRSTLGDSSSKTIDLGKSAATKASIVVEEPPTATTIAPALSEDAEGGMTATSNERNANGNDPEGYVNPFASSSKTNGHDTKKKVGLEGGFAEARSNRVTLSDMRGIVLEKVVEYLCWRGKYQDAKDIDIPKFDTRIMPEIALEL